MVRSQRALLLAEERLQQQASRPLESQPQELEQRRE
jgi:hypothetical protein